MLIRTRTYALILLALLLGIGVSQATAGTFTANFGAYHDFLTEPYPVDIWDGIFLGSATGTVATSNAGILTFQSANGAWENGGTGLLLYRMVSGDFTATLHVASADSPMYHDLGLMARVPNPGGSGSDEDWVAARYFAAFAFNSWRTTDGGGSGNNDDSGLQAWLQVERSGNTFYFRRSDDGVTFTPFGSPSTSIDRADMNGLALQVGIWQATFSGNVGTAQFDYFRLDTPDGVIPEPATLCLVALGGVVLAFMRRRRAA